MKEPWFTITNFCFLQQRILRMLDNSTISPADVRWIYCKSCGHWFASLRLPLKVFVLKFQMKNLQEDMEYYIENSQVSLYSSYHTPSSSMVTDILVLLMWTPLPNHSWCHFIGIDFSLSSDTFLSESWLWRKWIHVQWCISRWFWSWWYANTFVFHTSLTVGLTISFLFTVNNLASSPTDNDEEFMYQKENIVNSIPPSSPTTLTNNYNNKNATVSEESCNSCMRLSNQVARVRKKLKIFL